MAEIVNLRQARKRKARAADKETAAENRARFGRTGAAKAEDSAARDRLDRTVDGARLTDRSSAGPSDDETPRSD
jgi:hypothetical protein